MHLGRANDRENEVRDQTRELDQREPELSFSKGLHTEQLESEEEEPEEQEIAPQRDLVTPEVEDGADGIVFVRQHRSPDNEVVPANCGPEGAIDKAICEFGECAAAGIQRRHLAQGLHNAECNDTNDPKANQQRRRASLMQRASCADKQAGPDDTRQCQHTEMSGLEAAPHAAVWIQPLARAAKAMVRLLLQRGRILGDGPSIFGHG
ncbi:hypothetical protein V491_02811 [Pseudogymnoascus sp. VKM F-3775]|nr:hypothetical protein V491_02811 [Pseudogymnoascus sp. VKM F-3775]